MQPDCKAKNGQKREIADEFCQFASVDKICPRLRTAPFSVCSSKQKKARECGRKNETDQNNSTVRYPTPINIARKEKFSNEKSPM